MPPQGYNLPPSNKPDKKWLIISAVISVLFVGAVGFGVWAYGGMQDYKNNVQSKIDAAVKVAVQEESTRKDAEFTEKEKKPNKTYASPAEYGSITLKYPKTWSGHVIESGRSRTQLEGYFHPGVLPDTRGETLFALRLQLIDSPYSQELKKLDSKVSRGDVIIKPYKAENEPDVAGSYIVGEVNRDQNNTMVMLPLRDKTLIVWTESTSFAKDFNNIILKNMTFSP